MAADEQEQTTQAELVMVMRLCRGFGAEPVGPIVWMCRLAWWTLYAGQPFDADAAIAEHADWLNRPDQARTRANLLGCIEFLRRVAAKMPRWELPDNPYPFDVSQWFQVDDFAGPRPAGLGEEWEIPDSKRAYLNGWTSSGD